MADKKEKLESPWRVVFRRLKKNKLALFGLSLIVIMFLFSFIGPLFSPYGYNTQDAAKKLAPSMAHLLGTDSLGRDVLTRLMYAGRISLIVGLVAMIIQVILGASIVKSILLRNLYIACAFVMSVWLFIKMYFDHRDKG